MIHHVYGINVESEFELPAPHANDGAAVADLVVRRRSVDFATTRFAALEGVDDETEVWIEQGWGEGRVTLRFPDLFAELTEDEIGIDPLEVVDADYLAHVILDHVVPRWLALRGDLVLHGGSAVMPNGHAVAFIGDSGSGKSSLTTALGRQGWPVLGDDAVRLVRGEGRWLVMPAYPGTRLLGDSRRALSPGTRSTPMSAGDDKHRLIADVPTAKGAVRLGLVVALGDDHAVPVTARLSLAEATAGLVKHSFYLAPTRGEVAPRAFVQSSELAEAVPCVRLDFPRQWDVYPKLAQMLDELSPPVAP